MSEPSAFAIFPRRRRPLSLVTTRLGIRAAINSGKLTSDQVANLQAALDDHDIVAQIAQQAADSGLQDPSDPTTPAPKRDWTSFFAALGNFLIQIMPLIELLLKAFGGVAATSVAATSNLDAHGMHFGSRTAQSFAAEASAMPTDFAIPPQLIALGQQLAQAIIAAVLPVLQKEIGDLLKTAA